jgi:sphingosine kinase|tara:strand:- start:25696 stop:25833 length:138 start_codon:yes stop_codon:yes gene_type:complete
MASSAGDDDPFRDPSQAYVHVPDTLAVGREASLTLGSESLVIVGG